MSPLGPLGGTLPAPAVGGAGLSPDDLAWVCRLVRERTAIVLDASKGYLVSSRFQPLARARGFPDAASYAAWARRSGTAADHRELVEAMTTNETSWFRDGEPFVHLRRQVLPELAAARSATRTLRVWSAACSTGQEPYSLAMVLREEPRLTGWRTEVLATDVDSGVLARARSGRFSALEVARGLPAPMLARYFTPVGRHHQVRPDLQSLVRFDHANLAGPFPAVGRFDVVFCRNVLIYFDAETKRAVLERIRGVLAPDGYLVLGAAETTLGISTAWTRDQRSRASVYRPAGAATGSSTTGGNR